MTDLTSFFNFIAAIFIALGIFKLPVVGGGGVDDFIDDAFGDWWSDVGLTLNLFDKL